MTIASGLQSDMAADMTADLTQPEVTDLLARARVAKTPCGSGHLTWHVWGEPAQGRPLVLLHGGSGSWTHWLRNIDPLLKQGFALLVPDLPGFGDSDLPPLGKDADAMPPVLEQGLQELLGRQACDLMGFSFGAMVAGLWAQAEPARARQLVLVAPPGLGRPALEPIKPKAWRHLTDGLQRQAAHRHNLRELMLHHEASISALACQLQQRNAERDRLPNRRLSRTDVLAQALQQVRIPVHVVYGEQDRYYRHQVDAIEAVLRRCPGFARMHAVADAGHWAQFERPDEFQAVLLSIWRELPNR
jgi:2-hydroxy-6-oxonona-2,4-dienedioate hydrolase